MMETGARPGEVRKVTAAHVDLELGCGRSRSTRRSKRTGRSRVIYLTPAMVELPGGWWGSTRRAVVPRAEEQAGPHPQRGPLPVPAAAAETAPLKGLIRTPTAPPTQRRRLRRASGNRPGGRVARPRRHQDGVAHYSMLSQRVRHMREMAEKAASEQPDEGRR